MTQHIQHISPVFRACAPSLQKGYKRVAFMTSVVVKKLGYRACPWGLKPKDDLFSQNTIFFQVQQHRAGSAKARINKNRPIY
ncbi:MAG: hypothetical protein JXR70_01950 [Spirochaetales bacterium]|nr:hypothetical protein [Spirochaetales bacterium]